MQVTVDPELPPDAAKIYKLLLARSSPRRPDQQPGWRSTNLSLASTDTHLILGIAQPQRPPSGWNLSDRREPEITREQRLEAAQIMGRTMDTLRELGMVRGDPFLEINVSAVL